MREIEKKTTKQNTKSGKGRVITVILLLLLLAGIAWALKSGLPFSFMDDSINAAENNLKTGSHEDAVGISDLDEGGKTSDPREKERSKAWSEPFIIYLSGVDTRNQYLTDSNGDVNIVVVANPETREMLFVNTPRDYYVQISIGNGAYDKLSHCGNFGLQCSRDTIGILYDIDIDYAAQINFTGLKVLVDEIGGVDVFSDLAFTAFNGLSFDYGNNHLNGSRALTFCRERKSLPGGDNDRGRNQMKVLTAIISKITSTPSLILNYQGILDSLDGLFTTDMGLDDIASLVIMQIRDDRPWNISHYAVTGYASSSSYTYSMPGWNLYVTEQNPDSVYEAKTLIKKVLAGESI